MSCWRALILITLALFGCSTYRAGSGPYRGVGDFKSPADYKPTATETPPVENGGPSAQISDEDSRAASERLSRHSRYVPRYAFKLSWPVARVRINRGFHPPQDPKHSGIDLGGKRGTPILAAHEGVVIYVGNEFRGYGKMILVEYDDEWATLYGHLDRFLVRENTVVNAGDPIGTMGKTGRATGVHLHFELMHNHVPQDPVPLLTHPGRYALSPSGAMIR